MSVLFTLHLFLPPSFSLTHTAAGGVESSLFTAEMFAMYQKYVSIVMTEGY